MPLYSEHIYVKHSVFGDHSRGADFSISKFNPDYSHDANWGNSGHRSSVGVNNFKAYYYEVNGFKFTQYYYEYLWNNGRGGPSLTAKTILENATTIIPDPKQIPGFFKYFTSDWEMIYSPTTKIVAHIQPNPKLK